MPDIDFSNVFIVFLNGPPGSGKDSGATAVQAYLNAETSALVVQMKFAEALKRSVLVDAGLPYSTPLTTFEAEKDIPKDIWGGVSFRERCIRKSENYMKTEFGDTVFGRLFLSSVRMWLETCEDLELPNLPRVILVTDSGFSSEAGPILKHIPHQNALHARIHAEGRGKTFQGDSRNYITLPETVQVRDFRNNEPTPEGFERYTGELATWIRGCFNL